MRTVILSISLLGLILIGCSDDDPAPVATPDCAALLTTMLADSSAACTTYATSTQAFVSAGCSACEAEAAACLADGSFDCNS